VGERPVPLINGNKEYTKPQPTIPADSFPWYMNIRLTENRLMTHVFEGIRRQRIIAAKGGGNHYKSIKPQHRAKNQIRTQ
jgi:hypothetical protein